MRKYILLSILVVALFSIYILSTQPKIIYKRGLEGFCQSLAKDRYYELLKYENFKGNYKNISKARVNYELLREDLQKYNQKCKQYSLNEEKLIDSLYSMAMQEKRIERVETSRGVR